MRFQFKEVSRESQLHVHHLFCISKYIQIELFNPSLKPIIVNTSELSVELKWPFNYTKSVKFNKFSIIFKTNVSNKLYFIQNGIITI
jgi:hypothetical protein